MRTLFLPERGGQSAAAWWIDDARADERLFFGVVINFREQRHEAGNRPVALADDHLFAALDGGQIAAQPAFNSTIVAVFIDLPLRPLWSGHCLATSH